MVALKQSSNLNNEAIYWVQYVYKWK